MTELTDRMRTCAAYLAAINGEAALFENALRDASDMLLEASNVLENIPPPLGEPMAIIEAKPAAQKPANDLPAITGHSEPPVPKAVWITNAGDLPPVPTGSKPAYRPPRVCPACDSRANKRVFRQDNTVFLACPVCAHAWEYKP